MKRFLLILAVQLVMPCAAFEPNLTVAIAARMSYPATLAALRNRVANFLDQIKISMMVDVQALTSRNLAYRAAGLADADREIYFTVSNRFDREFERISRKFILAAAHLDELDTPVKEKERFIKNMKKELEESIGALLKSYGAQFEIKK